ncbi:hypothetical protein GGTG_06185 [Gaeumannomyces tritici R3-111a-1]|uniref:UFSP1/2/DUB catalytic domain-containing protein n=1 Tax=Gaeumannomyces tritici (strain R3-111a-1) TaxID=644352 RepID=J3NY30_GAET3|nr:hypothetical protein GGTG_06185 [Gaeumannomyces tritici R3-111a-1]EJT76263.1 hypothetical protein GGTG_06185 [Gaeumannomyces tritici R3-111a-1]
MAAKDETSLQLCPFCGYQATYYSMLLHMEEQHSEGDSPFVATEAPRDVSAPGGAAGGGHEDADYVACPIGCGEWLVPTEVAYHVDLHAQEEGLDDPGATGRDGSSSAATPTTPQEQQQQPRQSRREREPQPKEDSRDRRHQRSRDDREGSTRHHRRADDHESSSSSRRHRTSEEPTSQPQPTTRRSTIQAWRDLLSRSSPSPSSSSSSSRRHRDRDRNSRSTATASSASTNPPRQSSPPRKRLGKAELGKYAHEDVMPDWLITHLKEGGEVKADGILTVLEQLLEQSPTTRYAYLCHPGVQHISKLKKEGGFCGYRNIQMLVSFIMSSGHIGAHHFEQLPSVFKLQDWIEDAWDQGINAHARIETGGIRMTRKYIGTPEAQAVFGVLQIPCESHGFKNREPGRSESRLLAEVERYFETPSYDPAYKVRRTNMPPLYFQHAGHSMTIVGIERTKESEVNLLVFDPMFRDSSAIVKLVGREFDHRFPDLALKPYRRGHKYLKKYEAFEILKLAKFTQSSSSAA